MIGFLLAFDTKRSSKNSNCWQNESANRLDEKVVAELIGDHSGSKEHIYSPIHVLTAVFCVKL